VVRIVGIVCIVRSVVIAGGLAIAIAGCGLVYQAHTQARASNMLKTLQTGESSLDVHNSWGEPDIRNYVDDHTQVWSYAKRANTNDLTAELLYTAPKEGDAGRFVDLKFVDGKLASWQEADHQMPEKEGGSFSYGLGGSPGGTTHY
jgi:hypothetical protein